MQNKSSRGPSNLSSYANVRPTGGLKPRWAEPQIRNSNPKPALELRISNLGGPMFGLGGSEFRTWGSEFRTWASEFGHLKAEIRISRSEARVSRLEVRARKSEFRNWFRQDLGHPIPRFRAHNSPHSPSTQVGQTKISQGTRVTTSAVFVGAWGRARFHRFRENLWNFLGGLPAHDGGQTVPQPADQIWLRAGATPRFHRFRENLWNI